MNKWKNAYLLLLLIPAALILLFFVFNKFQFHSDDCEYWIEVIFWRNLFARRDLLALYTDWPGGRSSLHSLLGVPLLWLGGGVPAATAWGGIIFLCVLTGCAFRIFRAGGVSLNRAILGAVTVGTFPYLIALGKVFLPEVPFVAVTMAALACLFTGRVFGVGVLYTIMVLLRPFESLLLVPGFFCWVFLSRREARMAQIGAAVAIAFCTAIAALSGRPTLFWLFFHGALFPDGTSGIHLGLENLRYVFRVFHIMFGIPGMLLVLMAFYYLWKCERAMSLRWATAGILILVVGVLGVMSTFGNYATRETFGRYSLVFVVTCLVGLSLPVLKYARRGWPIVLYGLLLIYHLCIDIGADLGPSTANYFSTSTAMLTAHGYFHYHFYPAGNDELAKHLARFLPEGGGFVLFAGRDPYFSILPRRTELFMLDKWPRGGLQMATHFPVTYVENLVPLAIETGPVRLAKHGVSALVFVRKELEPGNVVPAYPNEPLVAALENGNSARIGLKLATSFTWTRLNHEQQVEIYVPDSFQ